MKVVLRIILTASLIGASASAPHAALVQTERRASAGESSMPRGKYEVRREELGLIKPKPDPYDDALAEMCRRYASADAQTRSRVRRSVGQKELYTLIGFAQREAVFGLRERSAGRLADGLTALAMIEEARVDERDMLVSLGLLDHSAVKMGADAGKLFRDAAALAEAGTSRLMLGFLGRAPEQKDLRAAWGYDEVETEAGVGFISFDFEKYDPTYDLKQVAVGVADLLVADKYDPSWVAVGSEFPRAWLKSGDDWRLERALSAVRAGAQVRAAPRSRYASQMFAVFIVELADEASARDLLNLSREKKYPHYNRGSESLIGVAEGRLFCLVVASSHVVDAGSNETPESLGRFSEGLSEILRRASRARDDSE